MDGVGYNFILNLKWRERRSTQWNHDVINGFTFFSGHCIAAAAAAALHGHKAFSLQTPPVYHFP
jgi:hypothetical protein